MNRGFAGRATVDTASRAKAPGVCTCVGIEFLLSFLPLLSRSETERRRERRAGKSLSPFLWLSLCGNLVSERPESHCLLLSCHRESGDRLNQETIQQQLTKFQTLFFMRFDGLSFPVSRQRLPRVFRQKRQEGLLQSCSHTLSDFTFPASCFTRSHELR